MKVPLLVSIFLSTLLGHLSFQGMPSGQEEVASSNEAFEKEVLLLMNTIRQQKGLPALQLHPDLTKAARYHAKDMSMDRYFEHDSHDRLPSGAKKRLGNFGERLRRFAPNISGGWAENLAVGQRSPKEVMHSWMNSTGHRKNILNRHYQYIGIGYVDGYWVQDFAHSFQ